MEDEYRAVADVASDNEDEVFDEQLDYDDDESNRHGISSKQSHKGTVNESDDADSDFDDGGCQDIDGGGEEQYTSIQESQSRKQQSIEHGTHDDIQINSSEETMRVMYEELQLISAQLKTKNMELFEREKTLEERERKLELREIELEKISYKLAVTCQTKVNTHQITEQLQESQEKIQELQAQLKDKTKNSRRLRASFDTLSETNAQLRTQHEDLQIQSSKLEKQNYSMRQRLENLLRCQEFKEKQLETHPVPLLETKQGQVKVKTTHRSRGAKTTASIEGGSGDAFVTLLEWTVKDILKPSFERGKLLDGILRSQILDNCQKMLPSLVDMVKDNTNHVRKSCLPCLKFIYWSCLLLERNPGKQSVGLGGAQRKLAEELYQPLRPLPADENSVYHSNFLFVRSTDLQIRMLSYLILLRTLSQVDCVANVFTLLKQDLRDELSKELFIFYHGPMALLNYFKPTAKAMLPVVLDIYLLMCVESGMLKPFLLSCSSESWFRSVAMVLRIPSLDHKQLEKISVLLQKLSKLKENKRHLEMFSIRGIVQDLVHNIHSTDNNSFLLLNLKSVLFNLTTSTTASLGADSSFTC